MSSIESALKSINERIVAACERAGREPSDVAVVGVTKRFPTEVIQEVISLGVFDLGENYAQELQQKQSDIANEEIRWHFIGKLQRNKVKNVVGSSHLIHAIDSLRLLKTVETLAEAKDVIQPILIAVNVAGETQKSGIDPAELSDLLAHIADSTCVECQGLMTMPPEPKNPEDNRDYYKILKNLRDVYKSPLIPLETLSMGTSGDFEVAIEEGATLVRLGTALFGERPS